MFPFIFDITLCFTYSVIPHSRTLCNIIQSTFKHHMFNEHIKCNRCSITFTVKVESFNELITLYHQVIININRIFNSVTEYNIYKMIVEYHEDAIKEIPIINNKEGEYIIGHDIHLSNIRINELIYKEPKHITLFFKEQCKINILNIREKYFNCSFKEYYCDSSIVINNVKFI